MKIDQFIELNRNFHDLTKLDDYERAAFQSYAVPYLDPREDFGWDQVLSHRFVVILGEPGSGKTSELRHQAEEIKRKGDFAFFIFLDRLIDAPLKEAITYEDEGSFSKWKGSRKQATFFLDAVDESKMRNQKHFYYALDHFFRGISHTEIHSIKIIISSRISEWWVHADRDELLQRLRNAQTPQESIDNYEVDSTVNLHIFRLEPLSRNQVCQFVEGIELNEPHAFIKALDEHHAWMFARRPIDVIDLIVYWEEHGHLGTFSELIEFALSKKLQETKERDQHDLLTKDQTRLGAECMGAAVLFCRRFDFILPDRISSDDHNRAMEPCEALPGDWTPTMCKAMLNRAVFDSASYGLIRFHDRRIAEYLAASWLETRMKEGCPYPVLEDLLFDDLDNNWIIRSSLRPVTAWIASGNEYWNQRIRERIISTAPDLFLVHGDPESLPIEYRRSVLSKLVEKYGTHERNFLDIRPEALARLASSELAIELSNMLKDTSISDDIRILLLNLIGYGRLSGCQDAVLDIIASEHESDDVKFHAVEVIREIGESQALQHLSQIAKKIRAIDADFCAVLCITLYPNIIAAEDLANLLRKVKEVSRNTTSVSWLLSNHFEKALKNSLTTELLEVLVGLGQEYPRLLENDLETPVSKQFFWIGGLIVTALLVLLKQAKLNESEVKIAGKVLWLLGCFKQYSDYYFNVPEDFNKILNESVAVRRAYVWAVIAEIRRKKPDQKITLFRLFNTYEIVNYYERDIDWLIQDICKKESFDTKKIALRLSIQFWINLGCKRSIKRRIKHAVKKEKELYTIYKDEISNGFYIKLRQYMLRHGLIDWRYTLKNWKRKFNERYLNFRYKNHLLRNLKSLRSGQDIHNLTILAQEANDDNNHWGAKSIMPLIAKRGKRIAHAAVDGWKIAWLQFEPVLPHQKPSPNRTSSRVTLGLTAINIAFSENGKFFMNLSPNEAQLATRYALNELNGFAEWLPELALLHPADVTNVLNDCIYNEWKIAENNELTIGVINDLRSYGRELLPLVVPTILENLTNRDPLNTKILDDVLTILFNYPHSDYHQKITDLIPERIQSYQVDNPRFKLYLMVWLQLDASQAITVLKEALLKTSDPTKFMELLCASLSSRDTRAKPLIQDPDYMHPEILAELILLVHEHVRVDEDTDRLSGEAYTPNQRDHAQDFRNALFERLAQHPDQSALDILKRLTDEPILRRYRDWIFSRLRQRLEIEADHPPWSPKDIPMFIQQYETEPHSTQDLFKIACNRFISIKDAVERGDLSARYDLHPGDDESRLRDWLARQLRDKAGDKYTVPPEEVIDQEQRPDLRIEKSGLDPISIEIKWVEKYSVNDLLFFLHDQLVGQYLRAHNSHYGLYALGYIKKRSYWIHPDTGERINFSDVIQLLEASALEIINVEKEIYDLKIFTIDFTRPAS